VTESPRHKALKRKLLEIGISEGFTTDKEVKISGHKLDAAWFVSKRGRLTLAFEVELSNQIAKCISALKTSKTLNGSHGVLAVPENAIPRTRALISDGHPEMVDKITVIDVKEIDVMYKLAKERKKLKNKWKYEVAPV